MNCFIIESEGAYLTDADYDIADAKWTDEIDLATPFRTEAKAWRAVRKWDEYYGVDLQVRIFRYEF